MVGCVGAAGTAAIAKLKEKRLSQRFSTQFTERCRNADQGLEMSEGAVLSTILREAGVSDLMEADEGGIMAALWRFFEGSGFGFTIKLRQIPLLQETVEVCELFEINPYCLLSTGCLLFTADHGWDAVEALAGTDVVSAVIGKVTQGPGKHIYNGDVHSFLNRPKQDELYCIIDNEEATYERKNFGCNGEKRQNRDQGSGRPVGGE